MTSLVRPNGNDRWAVILAGGDGVRLRALTRRIAGDERPKQFCRILSRHTLLEQTRRRAALVVPPERIVAVVTRAHERFYAPLLADTPGRVAVQPENRDTAAAILYALSCIGAVAPTAAVVVLPSDHYVSDDTAFMAHVADAFEAVRVRPDLLILLGITAETPEEAYGWIEPADRILACGAGGLYRVRRFWEKPALPVARMLLARGCLWNSFVMVGRVPAFLTLIRHAAPELFAAFATIRTALHTPAEEDQLRALYGRLPPTNFSRDVLATRPANLAVLPVSGVAWSDLGEPHRVLDTLAGAGLLPQWNEESADRGRLAAEPAAAG